MTYHNTNPMPADSDNVLLGKILQELNGGGGGGGGVGPQGPAGPAGSPASQTPWAQNIDGGGFNLSNAGDIILAASKRFSGIGAVRVYPDGPTLLAATPEYAGQPSIALDGLFSIPRTANAANHTDAIVLASSILYYNQLTRIGAGGNITAGNITCEDIVCGVVDSESVLADAIGGTDHEFQCTGGTFADNVLNIFNGTGGFSAIAFWAPSGTLKNANQYATGFAPAGSPPYAGSMYCETNALDPVNAPPDMYWSQFQNTSGGGLFNHIRMKMDGTARTTILYGWNNAAALGPVALTVNTDGSVTFPVGITGASSLNVLKAGDTMTGKLTIAQATANTEALTSTGYSLTGANAQSLIDLAGTWNTSGTPTALKLNITNTASNAASLLADLQVGAVSKFRVGANGFAYVDTITGTAGAFSAVNFGSTTSLVTIDTRGVTVRDAYAFQWASGGNATSAADLVLTRDAANTLAQRNGANAQTFRLYNTFTTVETAGEWFKFDWVVTANQFRFGAVRGSSSGTSRVASWDYGAVSAAPTAAITVPATSGNIVFGGGVQLSNAAVTGLAAGVLSALTNASIVLYDSTGQAYRIPCII